MKESYLSYHYFNLAAESEWIFVTPSPDAHMLHTTIQEMGHFLYTGGHYTERGPLESYHISISLCDTPGTLRIHGKEHQFGQANEILFIDCTQGYRIETSGNGDAIFVHFWDPAMRYYYDLFTRLNAGSPIVRSFSPVVERNLRKLLELYRKPNDFHVDLYAETLIMEMILDVIRTVMPSTRRSYGAYVQSTIQIIGEKYMENLTLDLLAEEVHVSKYYLSHTFKKETGLSILTYLQQFRLGKAKELLRATNFSQERICVEVGIYNCSYLCKLFKAYEHTTPDQYRKRWT